jgi:hypothetical protein
LLKDIVHGRLVPGQHLVAQALAERFGVSHTPIREALMALAGSGVVDLLPNRGAVVRRLTSIEVREICQVRCVPGVRGRAVGLRPDRRGRAPRHSGGAPGLIGREAPAGHGSIVEARALDSRLHDLVAASCGNSFLVKEINRLKILFRTFRDASWEHVESRHDYRRFAEESRSTSRSSRPCSRATAGVPSAPWRDISGRGSNPGAGPCLRQFPAQMDSPTPRFDREEEPR